MVSSFSIYHSQGRSPFWNNSKSAIALYPFFSTKVDRYQLITIKLVTFPNSRSPVTKLAEFWIAIAAITASGSFKRCCWRISMIFSIKTASIATKPRTSTRCRNCSKIWRSSWVSPGNTRNSIWLMTETPSQSASLSNSMSWIFPMTAKQRSHSYPKHSDYHSSRRFLCIVTASPCQVNRPTKSEKS